MQINNQININASADKVWEHITNYELVKKWNYNLKKAEKVSLTKDGIGSRWRLIYELGKKQRVLNAEVIAYRKNQFYKVIFQDVQQSSSKKKRDIYEEYNLIEKGKSIQLEQVIKIDNSGIPLMYRLLMAVVTCFGQPIGPSYLKNLKDLVEKSDIRK